MALPVTLTAATFKDFRAVVTRKIIMDATVIQTMKDQICGTIPDEGLPIVTVDLLEGDVHEIPFDTIVQDKKLFIQRVSQNALDQFTTPDNFDLVSTGSSSLVDFVFIAYLLDDVELRKKNQNHKYDMEAVQCFIRRADKCEKNIGEYRADDFYFYDKAAKPNFEAAGFSDACDQILNWVRDNPV